jgi:hypothetical protein
LTEVGDAAVVSSAREAVHVTRLSATPLPRGDWENRDIRLVVTVHAFLQNAFVVVREVGNAQLVGKARIAADATVIVAAAIPMVVFLIVAARHGILANDFSQAYLPAARAVLHGASPFQAHPVPPFRFIYPPIAAFLVVPLTVFSVAAAEVIWVGLLAACAPATLWVLGVRDVRCYAVILFWLPVFSAIQTGNLSLPLAFGVAILWRCRERTLIVVLVAALMVAVKIFLFPLLIFVLAARGRRIAAATVGLTGLLVVAPWAALGFAGLAGFPRLVRAAGEVERAHSYTVQAVTGPMFGWHVATALAIVSGLGLALIAYRSPDLRVSLVAAIAASLAMTPTVSLHYLALLLPIVALAAPTLELIWLLPLGMCALGVWAHSSVSAAIGVAIGGAVLFWSARERANVPHYSEWIRFQAWNPFHRLMPPPYLPSTSSGSVTGAVPDGNPKTEANR